MTLRTMASYQKMATLMLTKGVSQSPVVAHETEVLRFEELRQELRDGAVFRRLLRYREVILLTPDAGSMPRPLLTTSAARLFARHRALLVDGNGRETVLSLSYIARLLGNMLRDVARRSSYLRRLD